MHTQTCLDDLSCSSYAPLVTASEVRREMSGWCV